MSVAFFVLTFGFITSISGIVVSGVFILMGSDEQWWLWLIFTASAVMFCSILALVAVGGRKVAA